GGLGGEHDGDQHPAGPRRAARSPAGDHRAGSGTATWTRAWARSPPARPRTGRHKLPPARSAGDRLVTRPPGSIRTRAPPLAQTDPHGARAAASCRTDRPSALPPGRRLPARAGGGCDRPVTDRPSSAPGALRAPARIAPPGRSTPEPAGAEASNSAAITGADLRC